MAENSSVVLGKRFCRFRKFFGKDSRWDQLPNLIELQRSSYDDFLQMNIAPDKRKNQGIQAVFDSCFPVQAGNKKAELQFKSYSLEPSVFTARECKELGYTYTATMRAIFRLIVWDVNEITGVLEVRDVKEQNVLIGDFPLMTQNGTFIVNGIERVVVSQIHRSPGVFFVQDELKGISGKSVSSARVIPYKGAWLDIEFDAKDLIYVKIDKKKKVLLGTFLMCLENPGVEKNVEGINPGYTRSELLEKFYPVQDFIFQGKDSQFVKVKFIEEDFVNIAFNHGLVNVETGALLVAPKTKVGGKVLRDLAKNNEVLVDVDDLVGRFFLDDFIIPDTGEIIVLAGEEVTKEKIDKIYDLGYGSFKLLSLRNYTYGLSVRDSIFLDKNFSKVDALFDISKVIRPGDIPTLEIAESLFKGQFFDETRYSLSSIGRNKLNRRLNLEEEVFVLTNNDIFAIVNYLFRLNDGHGKVDNIDSLSNRRIRTVGELVENQFRLGVMKAQKLVQDRIGNYNVSKMMPNDLLNVKPIISTVKDFFALSQLSQFMDQNNPLSEVSHKRRISSFGPGGLQRDRTSMEVRDVQYSHYGRICPVETPEGLNIGLIVALSTYAKINKFGFLESPYRKVVNSQVAKDVIYLNSDDEEGKYIAQANIRLDADGNILDEMVSCRLDADFVLAHRSMVDYIDLSPKQIISVATSLIPFVENDDAARALMGANMQRQAVPLLFPEAPLIGSGMEGFIARDSGVLVVAKRDGIVEMVDSVRIVIRVLEENLEKSRVDIYRLIKYQRSNDRTCINQVPIVKVGDFVRKGDVIADGPATERGELALGQNVMVAFMSWKGCSFEDSILLSKRLIDNDVFSSIHIEEYEIVARDTKIGNEEITRDIPGVSGEFLNNLDESGVIYIGAEVKSGDILVGKVSPKTDLSVIPEEKLLRAIFGSKAADVKDTSLRLPSGVKGTVVDVRILSRKGIPKEGRALVLHQMAVDECAKERDMELHILEKSLREHVLEIGLGKLLDSSSRVLPGETLSETNLAKIPMSNIKFLVFKQKEIQDKLKGLLKIYTKEMDEVQKKFDESLEKLSMGEDLPAGVLKIVKVSVAVKRKVREGDKMAGRHGNKGVVCKILPVGEMPHLPDGTPVDIVLNSLGISSRMNLGQILETHLGLASHGLGKKVGLLLDQAKKVGDTADLRNFLLEIWKGSGPSYSIISPGVVLDFKTMTDEEIINVAESMRKGVHMATPSFEGPNGQEIDRMLDLAGYDKSGQIKLIDGQTGRYFERPITVGKIFMMKLNHLVDEKMHARSTGPYAVVDRQPLRGRAQFGGQRVGEMEVWALLAYGAAHVLLEFLTVKSDDVKGRVSTYENIIAGSDENSYGTPESFNVLVKEILSLGLNLQLLRSDEGGAFVEA